MRCSICDSETKYFSLARLVNENDHILTPIYFCKSCNSFIRVIENDLLANYFKNSVYTDLSLEKTTLHNRQEFYKFIFSLTKEYNSQIKTWLDYGCAYGHFLDYLNKQDIVSYGIEISDEARQFCNSKGMNTVKYFECLTSEVPFDIVSFIDSFYYALFPGELLKRVSGLLREDGLLIIRDTNRNWLAKFDKYVRHKEFCTALIDHTIGYSRKSMQFLLQRNGFSILRTCYFERGKYKSAKNKLFNFIAAVLYIFSFKLINFLPGVIIIARKNIKHVG